jgi:hypothetical protein
MILILHFDQPCLRKIKENSLPGTMIENHVSLMNHHTASLLRQQPMFFYFISRVNSVPQVFLPRGAPEGMFKSCTVYTQCLNRGLYKE